jgi:hypothetical protein
VKIRRFPHLAREDADLLRSLPPSDAQQFECLVRSQHDADTTFHERQVVESSLPPGGFTQLLDSRAARAFSTGGGRRRPTFQATD